MNPVRLVMRFHKHLISSDIHIDTALLLILKPSMLRQVSVILVSLGKVIEGELFLCLHVLSRFSTEREV